MIRITFCSRNHRAFTDEYDTDNLADALAAHFKLGFTPNPEHPPEDAASNRGPDAWVFGFIVERDGVEMTPEAVATEFKSMADFEMRVGGGRNQRSKATWERMVEDNPAVVLRFIDNGQHVPLSTKMKLEQLGLFDLHSGTYGITDAGREMLNG